MQKIFILLWLGCVAGLCGCEKQAKLNSQKIDLLAENVAHQDQMQAKQMALLQAQLAMLAPQLDKETSAYFEKNHDYALFFHTNTLYLLLTIGKKIESQLQAADAAREAQNLDSYRYHTNQLDGLYQFAAQIEAAMTSQEHRIQESLNVVNDETRRTGAAVSNALMEQIKAAAVPDPALLDWRKQMDASVAQMQRDLNSIKSRLASTNWPPAAP